MKIDESTINHNVTMLIDELALWDIVGDDMNDTRIMTLGFIAGVNDLAKALRDALRE